MVLIKIIGVPNSVGTNPSDFEYDPTNVGQSLIALASALRLHDSKFAELSQIFSSIINQSGIAIGGS